MNPITISSRRPMLTSQLQRLDMTDNPFYWATSGCTKLYVCWFESFFEQQLKFHKLHFKRKEFVNKFTLLGARQWALDSHIKTHFFENNFEDVKKYWN